MKQEIPFKQCIWKCQCAALCTAVWTKAEMIQNVTSSKS